jgi:hypothetical protein
VSSLTDNHDLQKGNKAAKVAPLYNRLNENLKKRGIFYSKLSIDESMVPYYGKHSAKIFIKMKPIRFGYKLQMDSPTPLKFTLESLLYALSFPLDSELLTVFLKQLSKCRRLHSTLSVSTTSSRPTT